MLEVKINDRTANVKLLKKEGNLVTVEVDDRVYDLDMVMVENGVYSVLYNNISYNVELFEKSDHKHFNVNTLYNSYDVEIIDAETKYKRNRNKEEIDDIRKISSPMPGKVVKILVKKGDKVKAGDTVVIVSAMKMESEYKSPKDGKISKIHVSEGSTVDANQVLIEIL